MCPITARKEVDNSHRHLNTTLSVCVVSMQCSILWTSMIMSIAGSEVDECGLQ